MSVGDSPDRETQDSLKRGDAMSGKPYECCRECWTPERLVGIRDPVLDRELDEGGYARHAEFFHKPAAISLYGFW